MATDLTNVAVSTGYVQLLHIDGGVGGSVNRVYDGDGTGAPLQLSTTVVEILDGANYLDVASHDGTYGLKLGGTLVTSSATELNYNDITTLGTAQASKVLTTDANIDVTGIRNLTATGTITAANFTGSGDTTIGDAADDTVAINSTITTNLIFEGATANNFELTLTPGDPTADRTLTLPDATDTLVGKATTDILTNKTLTSPVLNTADINTPDIDGGTVDAITSLTVANNVDIGNYTLTSNGLTIDGTFTDGTLSIASGSISSAVNGTFSGTVSFGTLTDSGESISITKFVDELDGISANDNDTTVPTSAAVKDYVDTTVTGEDLDVTTDSGTIAIDLDSETLTLAGGTGVDTSAATNTVTFALDLNELTTETTIADADFIAMVDATDNGSGKITFENLEDAIFASVSGDISITEAGVATIVNDAVTYAKMQNVSATDRVLGRDTAGAGDVEEISPASLRTMINVEDGSTADQTDAEIRTAVENATDSNVFTDADHSKLDGIEASADVTDATNVNAAGAVMESDTSTATMSFVVDEDDMASNSATKLATQQSIKAYVDSVAQGLNVKTACAVATTANITLSGEQSIDGVTTSTSRVLVKDQTDASANGIYVSAAGAWSRATDFDNPQEVASSFVFIESGTTYADTGWVCTNEPESVTVGTDNITFSQFSDAGHITAGTGLTKSGNTLSVNAAQTQITSVGALNAGSITSGFGSIDNGSSTITTTGALSAGQITGTSFVIGAADIGEAELEILDGATVTTTELNIMDGDTTATATTVVDADRVVMNDAGVMKQVAVTDLSAYFDDEITAMPNLVSTGALNSGSITSGFGNIDNGSSTITTTGAVSTGALTVGGNIDFNSGTIDLSTQTVDVTLNAAVDALNFDSNTLSIDALNNRVGIGTNNPGNILDIHEDKASSFTMLQHHNTGTANTANQIIIEHRLETSTTNRGAFQIATSLNDITDATRTTLTEFKTLDSGTFGTAMAIDGGSVGIGTTSPTNGKLHIHDTGTGGNWFHITDGSTGATASDGFLIGVDGSANASLYNYENTDMIFSTNSSERMRIDSAGDVLGNGELNIYSSTTKTGAASGRLNLSSTGDSFLKAKNGEDVYLSTYDTSAHQLILKANGYVGIGTTSPESKLAVKGSSGDADLFSISDVTVPTSGAEYGTAMIKTNSTEYALNITSYNASGKGLRIYNNGGQNAFLVTQAGGDRFVVDGSGNVGIGMTSPSNALDIERTSGNAVIRATATGSGQGARLFLRSHNTDSSYVSFNDSDDNTTLAVVRAYGTAHATTANRQALAFETAGSERMRIKSDGQIVTDTAAAGLGLEIQNSHTSTPYGLKINFTDSSPNDNTQYFITCQDSTNDKFIVYSDGDVQSRTNSYTGISDERLKENIVDATSKLDELNQVRVVNYNFKDEPDRKQLGVVAQELQEIFPKMVSEYGEDGYLGVRYSVFVPMLIKAVQELSAKVEALENA